MLGMGPGSLRNVPGLSYSERTQLPVFTGNQGGQVNDAAPAKRGSDSTASIPTQAAASPGPTYLHSLTTCNITSGT